MRRNFKTHFVLHVSYDHYYGFTPDVAYTACGISSEDCSEDFFEDQSAWTDKRNKVTCKRCIAGIKRYDEEINRISKFSK